MSQKIAFALVTLLFSSCAGSFKHKLNFKPTQPLRVAVLPMYQEDNQGNVIDSEIQIFQSANQPELQDKEAPAVETVMTLLESELHNTSFDIVAPASVRATLVHHGYTSGRTYDFKRIHEESPARLCELLACDAVLLGKLTEWSQSYFIAESVSTVGLDLRLLRASDGKELYSISAEDSEGRGLSKGPTGYSDLVLEPLKGLREGVILELARIVVKKSVEPLLAENLPEFKTTHAPVIHNATHSAPTGVIEPKKPLIVLMVGSVKRQASFSIGDALYNIPMVETDRGHYRGEYHPLPGEHFKNQPVTVRLADQYGRQTTRKIALNQVSLGN